jgi:nicotinate-nucleotide pyrophosphorylase (carboxylating)
VEEGVEVEPGAVVCSVYGEVKAVLAAERTALNLLQRLSGVATNTAKYVKELKGSSIKLLDTRKTTPGLRPFEKYATRVGGAYNHRFGLYDAVMIKDNHLKVYGSLKEAVVALSKVKPVTAAIEVEVENFSQLEEALSVIDLIDLIMLDNWPDEKVEEAVSLIRRRSSSVKVELSGGVDLKRLKFIKNLPIDFVSTSKLVTGAKWLDVSLELE